MLTIQMINDEIDIRIEKLAVMENKELEKNNYDLVDILRIRRREYESFKSWIESRCDNV